MFSFHEYFSASRLLFLGLSASVCLVSTAHADTYTEEYVRRRAEAVLARDTAPQQPILMKDITPPELHGSGHAGGESGHCEVHPALAEHEEGGFSTAAEYLLMRPRRGLFDYAIRDPNQNLIPEGALLSPNYQLRSGVRAAIDYRLPHTAWDFQVAYTYFRSNANAAETAPVGGTLYATLTRPGLNDEVTSATATATLEYNVYDAVIGRRFVLDEHATVRAFGGFAFAQIRQKFDVFYNGGDALQGRVLTESNFNGFGPLFGAEGQFTLTEHWHIYARSVGGLFTGTARNPLLETNNGGLTTYANLSLDKRKVVPMASFAVAGGWTSGRVTFRAGYEITNWFGLIDQTRLTGELSEGKVVTRSGDLSLEGFFAHFGLTF